MEADAQKRYVFVLRKLWYDDDGMLERYDYWLFDTYWAANREMFDDWTVEYQEYVETQILKEGEEWDEAKHDPDGFWSSQSRPFEDDWECKLRFPDDGFIAWSIGKKEVESLSKAWDDKPGYEPPKQQGAAR